LKAVRIHEHGGPEGLIYEEVPDPEPAPGEVLVELRAAALNHLDVWIRKGMPRVPLPRILGADGAGVRADNGEGVVIHPGIVRNGSVHVVGEHGDGTYAELIAVPAANLYPLPAGVDFEQAAAFPLVFLTVYRMLVTRAGLREGEWVFVWGVGSGVGSAAAAVAKALGARTIVTSSSDEKLERARMDLGVDVAINHAREDVLAAVREATDGHGADVVIEHVGQSTWERSILALAHRGRLVTCGATTGPQGATDLRYVFSKQLSILGSYMGSKAELLEAARFYFAHKLKPVVHAVLPLAEARRAHEMMERSEHFGKIVLQVA
jgi:NADPH:quinone reductase-like Zn-dependent oxidoreductase